MNNRRLLAAVFLAAIFGGLIALGIFTAYVDTEPQYDSISDRQASISDRRGVQLANYAINSVPEGLNFVDAADKVVSGVVHIRSRYSAGSVTDMLNPYGRRQAQSSGSGVIISDDGYIATNNHVIEDASDIEVILHDNRSYEAKVIGTDPSTDLALLKIDERNLSFVRYGDSDVVKPGQWVLAVGNPFNLTSTVTAGIVSAKARNIGILRNAGGLRIESFIQTDAAVNPGNSGGALVNLNGELIGVNTAIATQTGSFSGYSFAVPVTLVKKVMDDLLEFGSVQRGLLGIMINDVNARIAESEGLSVVKGVYIGSVNANSAAEEAGLEAGDVIVKIDGSEVDNVSALQERVARNRPGDQVLVTYIRNGREEEVTATLRNSTGDTNLTFRESSKVLEGADFEDVSESLQRHLEIDGGAQITRIGNGKWEDTGIKNGFIITGVDKVKINNVTDLERVLANKAGGILIEGVYENGDEALYAMRW